MILLVLVFVVGEVARGVVAYDVSYDDDGEGLSTWEGSNRDQAKLVKDEMARSMDAPGYSYIPNHHRPSTQPALDEQDDLYHASGWWHEGDDRNTVQEMCVLGIFVVILCLAIYVFCTCAANRRKIEQERTTVAVEKRVWNMMALHRTEIEKVRKRIGTYESEVVNVRSLMETMPLLL